MAEVNPTVQWQCDRGCGAVSEAVPAGTVPEGWLAGLGLRLIDGLRSISHLCPPCSQLPVAQARVPAEVPEPAE